MPLLRGFKPISSRSTPPLPQQRQEARSKYSPRRVRVGSVSSLPAVCLPSRVSEFRSIASRYYCAHPQTTARISRRPSRGLRFRSILRGAQCVRIQPVAPSTPFSSARVRVSPRESLRSTCRLARCPMPHPAASRPRRPRVATYGYRPTPRPSQTSVWKKETTRLRSRRQAVRNQIRKMPPSGTDS